MEWLKSLFRKPGHISPVHSQSAALRPEVAQARERAATLTQKEWVEEQLATYPIERLLEVSGIREAHIHTLRRAGIATLYDARKCETLPLMGATGDWVQEWLHNFIFNLQREYRQHRHHLEKAA